MWGRAGRGDVAVLVPSSAAELAADAGADTSTVTADVAALAVSDGRIRRRRRRRGPAADREPAARSRGSARSGGRSSSGTRSPTSGQRGRDHRQHARAGWSRASPSTSATSAPASPSTVAARAAGRRPQRARCPTALPADADFQTRGTAAQAYEQAWLACRLIAARVGPAGLVRFYRAGRRAAGGRRPAVAAALRAVLHETHRPLRRAVARLPDGAAAMSRATRSARRTLVVTNDFPPRQGGIQSFVHEMARAPAAPARSSSTPPTTPGSAAFDAAQPFPVLRHPTGLLRAHARRARRRVVDGAARLRVHRGVVRRGRAARPARAGAARRRGRAGRGDDARARGRLGDAARRPAGAAPHRPATATSSPTSASTSAAGSRRRSAAAPRLVQLTPGVDVETFRPGRRRRGGPRAVRAGRPPGDRVRLAAGAAQGAGHADRRAAAACARAVPDAALLLVGVRPLPRRARAAGRARWASRDDVVFTGGVAAERAAGALRRRRRVRDAVPHPPRAGWTSRGWASSTSRRRPPGCRCVAGDSGGAPDAVRDGETGYVVDGRDAGRGGRAARRAAATTRRCAARLGAAGRAWVERDWRWDDAGRAARATCCAAERVGNRG